MKKINYFSTYEINDLKDMLYKTTDLNKEFIAFKVKEKDGKITKKRYIDFMEDVKALSTEFIDRNLTNKRIAIMGKNSYNWAISYMAAVIVGVVVPIDKELDSDKVIEFLNIAEVDMIIADTKYLKKINENKEKINNKNIAFVDMQSTLEFIDFDYLMSSGNKLVSQGDNRFEQIKINPDEMRIMLFTSRNYSETQKQ